MFEEGTVAVVTGGTKGIGRAVSLRLAECGVSVVATYHADEEAATELESLLREYDQPTGVVQFDVGEETAVEAAVTDIVEEFGRPTVLINNAGTMANGLFVRMSGEAWEDVIRTNLTGAFYCTREILSHMLRERTGVVVNVSSVGAVHGWEGQANYAASKAGLIGLTRSLAREVGGKGIRVNAVCPGYTETELLESGLGRGEEDVAAAVLDEESIPQDRLATPEEVADTIVFLASPKSSYVNGSILRIDGGLLA